MGVIKMESKIGQGKGYFSSQISKRKVVEVRLEIFLKNNI
jgi:hypothetical protein